MRNLFFEGVRWMGGLVGLLAVDLFAELYVFEWLQWNGTDKNDWFFMLWWILVLVWTLSCGRRLWRGRVDGTNGNHPDTAEAQSSLD